MTGLVLLCNVLVKAGFFISKAALFFNFLFFFFFLPSGNIDFPYSLSGIYQKKQIPLSPFSLERLLGSGVQGFFAKVNNAKKNNAQSSCQKLIYMYVNLYVHMNICISALFNITFICE